jgi:RNA polymerase sigma-70 factor, ECF subfamily
MNAGVFPVSNMNSPKHAGVDQVVLLQDAPDQVDAGLVERFRNGDTAAFEEIVHRYKDRVYNIVYRYLGNHEDARDVAQEVFIRAFRGINGFRGHAKVYTWLYSIAANLSRNRLRDMQRKGRSKGISLEALQEEAPALADGHAATRETPRSSAQHRELHDGLRLCLDALPDSFRMAFVLRVHDELSYEDIAISVGVPQGTVKSRLNQARRRLRDCLKLRGLL